MNTITNTIRNLDIKLSKCFQATLAIIGVTTLGYILGNTIALTTSTLPNELCVISTTFIIAITTELLSLTKTLNN